MLIHLASLNNTQVVFISSDRDEAAYNAYRAEMPWLAVPWEDLRFVADVLRSEFRVSKFPTVIIFSDKGARRFPPNTDESPSVGFHGLFVLLW